MTRTIWITIVSAAMVILAIILALMIVLSAMDSSQIPAGATVDGLGREVYIDKVPQRIVSLAPSNTEILFALGLEDRVVGVTEYCNYPEKALSKEKIGGFSTPDIERIVALEPDLVLAAPIQAETVIPALEDIGLTVFTLAPETLDDVVDSITTVGLLTGTKDEADELTDALNKRINAVTDKTSLIAGDEKPRVFYLIWHDPLKTTGAGTLADDLLAKAGGLSIGHDLTGNQVIDLETVVSRDPQVIIASVNMGTGQDLPWQYILTEPRLKDTQALRNDRVYKIDGDIVHRPGPRAVDGLEKMAEFMYPDLFE